jgi:hypothetical protein
MPENSRLWVVPKQMSAGGQKQCFLQTGPVQLHPRQLEFHTRRLLLQKQTISKNTFLVDKSNWHSKPSRKIN